MDMRKNKKAILFSLISVLFSMLFITLFSQSFSTIQEDRMPGSNIRIRVMDIYTRNFETYVADSIQIATYRTLDAITTYRDTRGFFNSFAEFNQTFHDCMFCGYVNCSDKIAINNCGLGQYDLTSRINNISQMSMEQINIKTLYTINSINIYQEYPFEVEVLVNISYNITDASVEEDYARWYKEKVVSESVSIIGLLDPAGYINDTSYARKIIPYSGPCEFNESCWDVATTRNFYQEESFRYYSKGTSFLQRYWNNYSDSYCCGIETILHPSELALPVLKDNSYIDQYYWSEENSCDNGSRIINVTLDGDEVHLDESTAVRYGVGSTGLIYCAP